MMASWCQLRKPNGPVRATAYIMGLRVTIRYDFRVVMTVHREGSAIQDCLKYGELN